MRPDEQRPAGFSLPRVLSALLTVLAALAGLVTSYDFGVQIGGPLVGVVLALNGALFCSIVVGALAERLCRAWPQSSRQPQPGRPG